MQRRALQVALSREAWQFNIIDHFEWSVLQVFHNESWDKPVRFGGTSCLYGRRAKIPISPLLCEIVTT